MGARHDGDDDHEHERESPPATGLARLIELGTAMGCGVFAALLGAGPAALRVEHDSERRGWLLLAAAAVPFTTVAVLVLREAYVGLRAYAGRERNFVRVFVSLWLGSSAVVLYLLGSVLRATTHHHALAGVTFALGGATIVLAAGFFMHRVAAAIEALRTQGHVRAYALLSTAAHTLVAVTVLAAARGLHGKLPPDSAATMVDVTALALASALAARPELRAFRTFALLGPIAAVVVVALGMTGFSPELGAIIHARAPAFALLLHWLGRG